MKQKPLIDDLIDKYLPKRYYGHEARRNAKVVALEFFKSARQEYSMHDIENRELFLGRKLTEGERERILKIWGFDRE